MKTYSFSEKYLGRSDDKTIHILPFCLGIICVAMNHLHRWAGDRGKPVKLLQAKTLAVFVEGSLCFRVFWDVFVLL